MPVETESTGLGYGEKTERGKGRKESKLPPECFRRKTVPMGKALAGP